MTTHLFSASLLIVTTLTGIAAAETIDGAAGTGAPATSDTTMVAPARPAPAADRPVETVAKPHDFYAVEGLYIRGGMGFAGLGNDIRASDGDGGDTSHGTVTGMGTVGELTIGGAVSSHWVLGGGVWGTHVFANDYLHREGARVPLELRQIESFGLGGFYADWYFAPKVGLHAQAGIGLAVRTGPRVVNGEVDGESVAVGAGITLAIGKDFWMSDRWGLSVMGRVTAAGLADETVEGTSYYHGIGMFPALVLGVTYNDS